MPSRWGAAFCEDVPGYTYHPNKTINGNTINYPSPPTHVSVRQLAAKCDATPGCKAFVVSGGQEGELKSSAVLTDYLYFPVACNGAWVKQGKRVHCRGKWASYSNTAIAWPARCPPRLPVLTVARSLSPATQPCPSCLTAPSKRTANTASTVLPTSLCA